MEDIPYAGTYDIPFIEKQKLLSFHFTITSDTEDVKIKVKIEYEKEGEAEELVIPNMLSICNFYKLALNIDVERMHVGYVIQPFFTFLLNLSTIAKALSIIIEDWERMKDKIIEKDDFYVRETIMEVFLNRIAVKEGREERTYLYELIRRLLEKTYEILILILPIWEGEISE